MGRALAAVSGAAAAVWREADEALGEPLSTFAWEGPAEELDLTVNAQPALLAASVAGHRALMEALEGSSSDLGPPAFHAGHSMGQYSAMAAAGVLGLADALRLVRERGRLMQDSSAEGAMAAIMGLPDERIGELVSAGTAGSASSGDGVLTIANRNSPGQIVISGQRTAVQAAVEASRGLGARRAIMLPVSVAAHSPLMAEAAEGMRRALADVRFHDPAAPLLANADATPLTDGEACRRELIHHLTAGVDWIRAVDAMRSAGIDTYVEVGPGKVLTGLVKRIATEARTVALDDITTDGGLVLPTVTPAQE
jgi:[acyl-carrier-protein] S-malonyltransferase